MKDGRSNLRVSMDDALLAVIKHILEELMLNVHDVIDCQANVDDD